MERNCKKLEFKFLIIIEFNFFFPLHVATYRIIIKVLDIDDVNDDNTKSLDCLYLTIFGEDGSTGELILKQENKIIKSNSNNEYELEGLNVGQVNKIKLSHNDLSSKIRMHIETVSVLKEENLFKFVLFSNKNS